LGDGSFEQQATAAGGSALGGFEQLAIGAVLSFDRRFGDISEIITHVEVALAEAGKIGAGVYSRFFFTTATCGEQCASAYSSSAHQAELFEKVFSIHREIPLVDDVTKVTRFYPHSIPKSTTTSNLE